MCLLMLVLKLFVFIILLSLRIHCIDKPAITHPMLSHSCIDSFDPQFSEFSLLHFTVPVRVLKALLDTSDCGTESIFGPSTESLGHFHFDNSFMLFGR